LARPGEGIELGQVAEKSLRSTQLEEGENGNSPHLIEKYKSMHYFSIIDRQRQAVNRMDNRTDNHPGKEV
jgi:hypothetical protein